MLTVLRRFDLWFELGPVQLALTPLTADALQRQIKAVPDQVVRRLLTLAMDLLEVASTPDPSIVAGAFIAYGMHLESEGRSTLAADVFHTIAEALDLYSFGGHAQLTALAYTRHGYSTMRAGNILGARASFDVAIELAESVGDMALILRSRIWKVALGRMMGNLGEAENDLDAIIRQAQDARLPTSEALAKRERGYVRRQRGRNTDSIRDYFEAYQLSTDRDDKDLVLEDLAACAAEAGYWRMASQAHMIVARTSENSSARNCALVNLLELAVWESDQVAFNRAQALLAGTSLSVELALHAKFYSAKAFRHASCRISCRGMHQGVNH